MTSSEERKLRRSLAKADKVAKLAFWHVWGDYDRPDQKRWCHDCAVSYGRPHRAFCSRVKLGEALKVWDRDKATR